MAPGVRDGKVEEECGQGYRHKSVINSLTLAFLFLERLILRLFSKAVIAVNGTPLTRSQQGNIRSYTYVAFINTQSGTLSYAQSSDDLCGCCEQPHLRFLRLG